jgi:hypothetical protein
MQSPWNTADEDPCRVSESATPGAILAAGLRFERCLGWALWTLFLAVLIWGGK